MAAPTSESFDYAYEITSVGGTFKLVDSYPSESGVNPIQSGTNFVTITDPNGGKVSIGQTVVASGEGLTENMVFIGQADVKDHGHKIDGIIIEDPTTQKFYFLTDTKYTGNLGGRNGDVTLTHINDTICFMAGTIIQTPEGGVSIETLKRGDLVLTHDGRELPVDWLGVQTVSLRFADKLRVLPIRIKAGALAENIPSRDLLVSPDHALLVEGALIQAGALVNGTSIVRETNVPTIFSYYHVEVEDHSLILAENTPAETFVDNVDRLAFDNWAEHQAIYPNGKQVSELPYPRAKAHRQVPVSIRVMLGARAQAIHASEGSAVA
jgi:hypothetical protein